MPALIEPRCAHIAYAFAESVVYVAFGWNSDKGHLSSLEKLVVGQDRWQNLELSLQIPMLAPVYFELESGKILIFGVSTDGKEQQVLFNVDHDDLERTE